MKKDIIKSETEQKQLLNKHTIMGEVHFKYQTWCIQQTSYGLQNNDDVEKIKEKRLSANPIKVGTWKHTINFGIIRIKKELLSQNVMQKYQHFKSSMNYCKLRKNQRIAHHPDWMV